ncbi:MAG: hypothetical protein ACPL5F_01430 [Moorellaceae bacterium]
MPPNAVKTQREEHLWDRAKEIVQEEYGLDKEDGSRFYRLVMGIFQRMKGEKKSRARDPQGKFARDGSRPHWMRMIKLYKLAKDIGLHDGSLAAWLAHVKHWNEARTEKLEKMLRLMREIRNSSLPNKERILQFYRKLAARLFGLEKGKSEGEHWITLPTLAQNPDPNADRRHILLDAEGRILGGDLPKEAQGKNIRGWWKEKEKPAEATQEATTKKTPVSPKVGRAYTAKVIRTTGGLKEGQEYTGTVRRIYRVRSGAVLAEMELPDGTTKNIPVSKYAEWYPTEEKAEEKKETRITRDVAAPKEAEKKQGLAAELISKYRIDDGAKYGRPGALYVPQGNRLPKAVIEQIRAHKEEILAELARQEKERQRRYEEEQARIKRQREAELAAIEAGEKPIELHWHEGEYLSGWQVFGSAIDVLEKLGFKKLGLMEYVQGWGWYVESEVARTLGKEFTYQDAAKFIQPRLEAEAEKKRQEETARRAKFEEAARTGKPVLLRHWPTTCDRSVPDCDVDIIEEYAMPDGTVARKRFHTH